MLWRRARMGEISNDQAVTLFAERLTAPVASLSMDPYLAQAPELAMEMGHPVSDCIYLAVALHHRTHVVTADYRSAVAASNFARAGSVRLLTA